MYNAVAHIVGKRSSWKDGCWMLERKDMSAKMMLKARPDTTKLSQNMENSAVVRGTSGTADVAGPYALRVADNATLPIPS